MKKRKKKKKKKKEKEKEERISNGKPCPPIVSLTGVDNPRTFGA